MQSHVDISIYSCINDEIFHQNVYQNDGYLSFCWCDRMEPPVIGRTSRPCQGDSNLGNWRHQDQTPNALSGELPRPPLQQSTRITCICINYLVTSPFNGTCTDWAYVLRLGRSQMPWKSVIECDDTPLTLISQERWRLQYRATSPPLVKDISRKVKRPCALTYSAWSRLAFQITASELKDTRKNPMHYYI